MKKFRLFFKYLMLMFVFLISCGCANGWVQNESDWCYYNNGSIVSNEWVSYNGDWYYLNENGIMATNRWIDNYYVGVDGKMLKNTTTPDGYWVGDDGKAPNKKVENKDSPINEKDKTNIISELSEEYKKSCEEVSLALGRQEGTFGGGYSFTELATLLVYQFNGFAYNDKEASECLADMIDVYDRFLHKNPENFNINVKNKNVDYMKKNIEYNKLFAKMILNDRKVFIECDKTHTGNNLVRHKQNDSLYKSLKIFLGTIE